MISTGPLQPSFLLNWRLLFGVLAVLAVVSGIGGCDKVDHTSSLAGGGAGNAFVDTPSSNDRRVIHSQLPSDAVQAEERQPLLETPKSFASESTAAAPLGGTSALAQVDTGAARLVEQISIAIGDEAHLGGPVTIAMRSLRNQSRAMVDEIELVKTRLLALLASAGEGRDVRFIDRADQKTEYTLGGTVYLVDREGVEYWEIFFALRPNGANWRIWKNVEPVRMLRDRRMAGDAIEFQGRS